MPLGMEPASRYVEVPACACSPLSSDAKKLPAILRQKRELRIRRDDVTSAGSSLCPPQEYVHIILKKSFYQIKKKGDI